MRPLRMPDVQRAKRPAAPVKPLRRWLPRKQPPALSSLDAYALWAASYPPSAHNALMRAEAAAVRALLPPLAGRSVLDLACGTGRWGMAAHEMGAASVIGLDHSLAMLTRCALRQRTLAALDRIPLAAGCVDVVLCGLALGHVIDPGPALAEIGRVLRPGGLAILSDFHPCLALSGAQRTFTDARGRTFAVEHHVHWASDYLRAAQAAGLRLTGLEEPALLPGDAIHAPHSGMPVALVLRFERPG